MSDTIDFGHRAYDRLGSYTTLEKFDLVRTGDGRVRVIAWPRGLRPTNAGLNGAGSKVSYYRERTELLGPVYIPPPRPEFATAEECKPVELLVEMGLSELADSMRLANALKRVTELEEEVKDSVRIPQELAKAVYKELAPGFVGEHVRALLDLIDEGAT